MSASHRFGPFFLDARIAVGGTAEVYLARPAIPMANVPDRLVVKRMLPHFAADADGRTMFDREAKLHQSVTHENVVTVYHAGKDDKGEPYLAMEYIDGVDGYRLLRRLRQESEFLPIGVAIYVAREVLRALESVHAAPDPTSGKSLGIVHRDVSPSNIYLSLEGTVKLGDFGIARSTTRATLRSDAGHVLKGKFAYLAPEQVAGETSDHRADLFSLATVLAEMLLNQPLFPGSGQLAILLSIRDCKIDALHEIKPRLPPGLFEVLQRALSRNPGQRYPNAGEFAKALAPFEADKRLAQREIAARVKWVKASGSSDGLAAQRDSAAMRAARPVAVPNEAIPLTLAASPAKKLPSKAPEPVFTLPEEDLEEEEEEKAPETGKTSEYEVLPSRVLKRDGRMFGPWSFARLMESLATGQIERGDRIDFVGRGFRVAEEIEEFARFFPAPTPATPQVRGPGAAGPGAPGAPDLTETVSLRAMLKTLIGVLAKRETGVLFIERNDGSGAAARGEKKELYFVDGNLKHVASSNASELLGEYLVRRGRLAREELDLALAVLPKYGGRMGDTLIALGLVGSVDVFRAIREQGRDRVSDLFLWRAGTITFFRGRSAPQVEFPLDLDVPTLLLAGLETARPGDTIVAEYRSQLEQRVGPATSPFGARAFADVIWPESVASILELTTRNVSLREIIHGASKARTMSTGDVLRALELLLATGLLAWK